MWIKILLKSSEEGQFRIFTMFIIQETLTCFETFVGFISVSNQLNAWS